MPARLTSARRTPARSNHASRPLLARCTALAVLASIGALPTKSAFAQGAPRAAAESPPPATESQPATPGQGAPAPEAATHVDPTVAQAAEHYDRGLKLHAEGDFALAAIEFERAYELVPNYRALFNIGQVRLQLGQYARAKRAFTQYLVDGGAEISEERKRSVEADLQMLAGRTGTLELKVNVAEAEIAIDDVPVGRSPFAEPLLLDAGEHSITVRKPGYQSKVTQITLVGGDALQSNITLEKTALESQRIIIEREKADSNQEGWMWGMWTATGVLAIAAGITEGLGVKAANDLEGQREELGATRSELDSASGRAQTLLVTGDILAGLAIAAGGTALYLTLTLDDEEQKPAASPSKVTPDPSVSVWVTPFGVNVLGSY